MQFPGKKMSTHNGGNGGQHSMGGGFRESSMGKGPSQGNKFAYGKPGQMLNTNYNNMQ